MKHVFVILAFAGIILQNLSKVIILANFGMNRDYISKNLCVKKDTPNNCCKGKCQLKKQLADDDKKEQSTPGRSVKDSQETQLFCQQYTFLQVFLVSDTEQSFIPYRSPKTISPSFSIFHPPPEC